MLLFQMFDAIVRLVIVANLALPLFLLNLAFNVVLFPVRLLSPRAASDMSFLAFSKSTALLSLIWNGKNH